MIKFIREFIAAGYAGHHSGKGHKCSRQGKYEEALCHYKLALEYEIKGNIGPNPVSLECIARTYARLGNYTDALSTAQKSYDLYKQLTPLTQLTIDCISRIERFIESLKSNDTDEIKIMLNI